jgi:hypothetical protein
MEDGACSQMCFSNLRFHHRGEGFPLYGEVARTEIALSVAISFFCVIGLPDKSVGGCSILPNRI